MKKKEGLQHPQFFHCNYAPDNNPAERRKKLHSKKENLLEIYG
jgi:hypothetical protein